jgi:hypothetical protein
MTNRNPASSYSQSSDVSKEILARVNAHADRSLDRVFADIEELLSGDLSDPVQPPPANHPSPYQANTSDSPYYPTEPVLPHHPTPDKQEYDRQYPPQSDFHPPTPPRDRNSPPTTMRDRSQTAVPSSQKKSLPLWIKALLGIGLTSVALSSLLLWLINTRKIDLPKNFDFSWLPFPSKSAISPDDAQFAEYMRKSIAKIEAANSPSATNNAPTNPATNFNSQPKTDISSSSPGVVTSTTPATIPVSLLKILPGGDRPGAEFEIQGKVQKVYVGEKISNSNWSLVTVAQGEVIVKKISGEIRSIYVGQKF